MQRIGLSTLRICICLVLAAQAAVLIEDFSQWKGVNKDTGWHPISIKVPGRRSLSVSRVGRRIHFSNLNGWGELMVSVSDFQGKHVAGGTVREAAPSLDLGGLKKGVYWVRAGSGGMEHAFPVALLE